MASDFVGLKVVEYLVKRGETIRYLLIDPADRGGFNSQIEAQYRSCFPGANVLSAAGLSDPDVVRMLAACEPRLGILAWWPEILKGPILEVPQLGWLNFHPSYLPYNRGKHPNFWCLVDETPCGVTLHYIDEGIDTGAIVAQRKLTLDWEDTAETVYVKARESIVELFIEAYDDIVAGRRPASLQSAGDGTFHLAREMQATCCIDLDTPIPPRRLLNILRAKMFSPHPPASFCDGGKTYTVEVRIKEQSAL